MEDQPLISAVIICAPPPVADFVRSVRKLHADTNSAAHVVPPHVTVMYPFMSPGSSMEQLDTALLEETTARLQAVVSTVKPFSLTLDRYGEFPGRVLYLALRDNGPVLDLYQRLLAEFPAYPLYGGGYGEIIPHLTVSVVETQVQLDALARPSFEPLTFEVSQLYFMYGDPQMQQAWQTAAVLTLGA